MRIRTLSIQHFRGINNLVWELPEDQRLITLIGPCDSGKSTIIEAINYLLSSRWNIPFSDTDFFNSDVSQPISISAVLSDLPDELLKDNSFGLWLSGIDGSGRVHQDPEDGMEVGLIIRLVVDESLEQHWTIERKDGSSQFISASQRTAFSTFKIDEHTDSQLRWSRTSALGKLSKKDGGDRAVLTQASRAARKALEQQSNSSLTTIAESVQEKLNAVSGGGFSHILPGLDTSRSSMGAGIALYESEVPLTSYGLGTRRLASLAVQQLAAGNRSIVLVDELENGLEPHRAVSLLRYLRTDSSYSQVFATTHSAIVVEQSQIANLALVRKDGGNVKVFSLSASSDRMQRIRRQRPSSLLAKKIILVEGKTEYGILLQIIERWDDERSSLGFSTSSGEGVAVQDASGGSEVALRATELHNLGYEVLGFMDNDDQSVNHETEMAEGRGMHIVRWDYGMNTESQICASLNADELQSLVNSAVDLRGDENVVLDDCISAGLPPSIKGLSVQNWLSDGAVDLQSALSIIAATANKRKWFKTVDGGRVLGQWIFDHRESCSLQSVYAKLQQVKTFIYPSVTNADDNND